MKSILVCFSVGLSAWAGSSLLKANIDTPYHTATSWGLSYALHRVKRLCFTTSHTLVPLQSMYFIGDHEVSHVSTEKNLGVTVSMSQTS